MKDFIAAFLKSKRNILAVGSLIQPVYEAIKALQAGQPIPDATLLFIGGIVSAWILGDSYRATMPKKTGV
jgi:hypothetical protein